MVIFHDLLRLAAIHNARRNKANINMQLTVKWTMHIGMRMARLTPATPPQFMHRES
jgi:hypothetical protein